MIQCEGRFKARILDKALRETESGNVEWSADLECYQMLQEDWVDIAPERIKARQYLQKKDGSINDHAIDSLKTSLGWDGVDINWLQDGTMPDIQITVGQETYNNRVQFKVQWINPLDWDGGELKKSDAAGIKAIAAKIGSKLRALSGGTAAKMPPPPKGKPVPPAPKRSAPPPTLTLEAAYAQWSATFADTVADEIREREWFAAIDRVFPGRQQEDLTGAELAKLVKDGLAGVTPF